MAATTTLVIISDLHPCYAKEDVKAESFLNMAGSWDARVNPVAGFYNIVQEENLQADYLLCPGDIGNKADPSSITFGWQQLQRMSEKLGASLLAVPGNHDHDSRLIFHGFDPKYHLQSLQPAFPFIEEAKNASFWAWHWASFEQAQCRFILLNTSAFHGLSDEFLHGRLSPRTLGDIIRYIEDTEERAVNVVLCHHHPQRLDEMFMSDYEAMDGGSELVSKLSDGLSGNWLIVHGHKHAPRIMYGMSAGSQATVVFAAGSFSGPIAPQLGTKATNQVHHVTIDANESSTRGCLCGQIRTWEWSYGIGWCRSASGRGLPYMSGFGFRENPTVLAQRVVTHFGGQPFYSGREIYNQLPELLYLTPDDLGALAKNLEQRHRARLEINGGEIKQYGNI